MNCPRLICGFLNSWTEINLTKKVYSTNHFFLFNEMLIKININITNIELITTWNSQFKGFVFTMQLDLDNALHSTQLHLPGCIDLHFGGSSMSSLENFLCPFHSLACALDVAFDWAELQRVAAPPLQQRRASLPDPHGDFFSQSFFGRLEIRAIRCCRMILRGGS